MKLIKHIGKLKDLDTKVLVVFMQLPEKKDHALIVATHTLPDLVQDEIMRLLESDECQSEKDLGAFLNRKTLPSGNGVSILAWLHSNNKLVSVPVSAVIMTPHPGYPTPLADLIKLIDESAGVETTETDSATKLVRAETEEEKQAVAENLMIEAKMLREEADKKEATAATLLSSKVKTGSKKKKSEGTN